MLTRGKDPDRGDGYAQTTADERAYRLDLFYRWVWKQENGYTTTITHDHADAWMTNLAYGDTSQENKASHQKALKMLFRWRSTEFGDEEWEPETTFSTNPTASNPEDFLTRNERSAVREAALELGSVPSYTSLSPDARDRWKAHLAQRFEKPKREVGSNDFERANSWKLPSLFWTALDAGLRPIEVERAQTTWVDTRNSLLRIPKEGDSKGAENWAVSLTDRTATALDRWLSERAQYEKYDGSDTLWLNRVGNPYQHYSLNRLFRKICEIGEIPSNKRIFYAIRHSVGTSLRGRRISQRRRHNSDTRIRRPRCSTIRCSLKTDETHSTEWDRIHSTKNKTVSNTST